MIQKLSGQSTTENKTKPTNNLVLKFNKIITNIFMYHCCSSISESLTDSTLTSDELQREEMHCENAN